MNLKLRKWTIELLLTVFFAGVVVTGYNIYLQKDMPKGLAPQIVAKTLDGHAVDLHKLSESAPVLVYFWASWCRVCQWTSPAVSKLSANGNYPVVTVALSSGTNERISAYMKAKDIKMPVINDDDGIISRNWAISVTPSFFIVRNGEITSVLTGVTTKPGLMIRLFLNR
ncbi:hypothetical protein GZ77_20750 [Endozoicomonas montiporae]|uniref:Thioredoxin domain-containing protein n=2 Tax=Endozoicomonas montiporae TaxID=1027273 RepID=A0A081N348_9GAMM|nr:protein disulfide oxidoreductase [Endozoicomonas montiporae]AMO58165.1 alkyl hydroperoxide reductase [Endozoicomonas montiporae CL-33]KEQ12871.1 hypothetical protein GZ77_20750 [Endozoicomonas montiporae]